MRRIAIGAAAASAGVGAVMAAGRAIPGLDVVTHFAPVVLVGCLVAFSLALAGRASRAALAIAFAGALAPAGLMAPELAAAARQALVQPPPRDAPRLRVLSVNLWSGNPNQAAFAALVRREQPDIIIVQEAWGAWKALLESLDPEYRIHAGCRYDSDCNLVILSKLDQVEVIAPWRGGMAAMRLELPPRFGAGSVDVMGMHLGRPITSEQIAEVAAIARALGPSAIVAGDLNATPWSRALSKVDRAIAFERRSRALFSWPAPSHRFTRFRVRLPTAFPIDHIYAGPQWRLAAIRRGPDVGSDHYPLIADFVLEENASTDSASTRSSRRDQLHPIIEASRG